MTIYNNIYILSRTPISDNYISVYGVWNFIDKGFNVHLWDLTPIFDLDAEKDVAISDLSVNPAFRIFKTKEEFIHEIERLPKDALLIPHITISFESLWIYRLISKNSLDYAVCNIFSFPDFGIKGESLYKKGNLCFFLKKLIKNLTVRDIVNKFRSLFPGLFFCLTGIKPANYFIAGGKKALEYHSYCLDKSTEICETHSFDYDVYLEEIAKDAFIFDSDMRYAVFLDQFLPFHPDRLYFEKFGIDPSMYYSSLSGFFDHLSDKLGIEIVIAAHPRADYDEKPDYFNGRKVIKGQTCRLVKNSEFVITHDSTTISYAVLYKKPIFFVGIGGMGDNRIKYISSLASLFNQTIICVGKYGDYNIDDTLKVDLNRYLKYEEEYIKRSGTPQKPLWDLFVQCINKNE